MKRISFVILVWVFALVVSNCTTEHPPTQARGSTAAPVPTSSAIVSTVTPLPTASLTPTVSVISQPSSDTQVADTAFASLLERVKLADPTIDFTEFRMTYAQTSQYDPYNFSLKELQSSMVTALNDKDYELALKLADDILAQNYIFPDAHAVAIRAHEGLGQSQEADYHRYVLNGLIKSILQSGNGKSPESAFVVVLIEEEYVILTVLDIEDKSQGTTDIDGHSYDIFDGIDSKSNSPVTVYFNIDIPFKALVNSLKP